MPQQTKWYRWIVELSCMSNNDEVILHAEYAITKEEFAKSETRHILTVSDFYNPCLVVCRPVFQEEIDGGGLDVTFRGPLSEEKNYTLTHTLDGLYKFMKNLCFNMQWLRDERRNPTNAIGDVIACWYYDCMSGGMPRAAVVAARELIKRFDCDLGHTVYPGKVRDLPGEEGWYTLGDFMASTTEFDNDRETKRLMPYVACLPVLKKDKENDNLS